MSHLLVLLLCSAVVTAEYESTTPPYEATTDPNVVGVASIAGITSRNGRVSSLGGIQFYPGHGSMRISNGNGFFYPLTVSAEKDGKYASGTVQIHPGYVAASARAGYAPPNQEKPYFNQMFLQPTQDLFCNPLKINPLNKDMFRNLPLRTDVRNGWLYPSFDPFVNFWR